MGVRGKHTHTDKDRDVDIYMRCDLLSFLLDNVTSVRDTVVELRERSDSPRMTRTCVCVFSAFACLCVLFWI